MNTGILIIAHRPLASALRDCVLHVYPEAADGVLALDVVANEPTDTTRLSAAALLAQLGAFAQAHGHDLHQQVQHAGRSHG